MNTNKAIEFINSIIDGVNPINGQKLNDKELFSTKEMLEALNMCIKGLELVAYEESSRFEEDREWSIEEEEQLIQEYCDGIDIDMLVILHQRSEESIKNRLMKKGIEIEL